MHITCLPRSKYERDFIAPAPITFSLPLTSLDPIFMPSIYDDATCTVADAHSHEYRTHKQSYSCNHSLRTSNTQDNCKK